jgi:hypothetical protein
MAAKAVWRSQLPAVLRKKAEQRMTNQAVGNPEAKAALTNRWLGMTLVHESSVT